MKTTKRDRAGDPQRQCVAHGECRPPHRSRKDTTRWCRGRDGIAHDWQEHVSTLRAVGRHDGELGYSVLTTTCEGCGRTKYVYPPVRRCHCGGEMRRPAPSAHAVAKWGRRRAQYLGRYFDPLQCVTCGYRPSDDIPQVYRNGVTVDAEPYVPCACEVAAAKAAKRAHYQQKFEPGSGEKTVKTRLFP